MKNILASPSEQGGLGQDKNQSVNTAGSIGSSCCIRALSGRYLGCSTQANEKRSMEYN